MNCELPSILTFGQYIIEFVKIVLILSIFIVITLFIVGTKYKQYVKDNWIEYRCNPLVMPFAGYFGQNSKENFSNCLMQVFNGYSFDMLKPINFNISLIGGILKDFTHNIQSIRKFFFTFRNLFLKFVEGIMKRIQDGASTLQYLITKLKATLERLWGILVTVIYVGFTAIDTMTSVWNGPIGGFAKFFCFDGESQVIMSNGKKKKISEININDEIYLGGRVIGNMIFSAENNVLCKYKNVIVSCNHLVKHNGEWKRLYEIQDKEIINNYDKPFIYCLVTENNLIVINDTIFSDYIETSEVVINSKVKEMVISHLNGTDYINKILYKKTVKDYYCSGFSGETLIMMKGGLKKIKNIKIGDITFEGKKITGIILQRPICEEICKLDEIILSASNIIFYQGKWKQVRDIENISYIYYKQFVYNVCVEDNILQIGKYTFRDYSETDNNEVCSNINNYIDHYLRVIY